MYVYLCKFLKIFKRSFHFFDFLIASARMRRSSYAGSSSKQRKKSRPSSCIKSVKKSRKEPKVKINVKYSEANKRTEKLKKTTRKNADIYAQDDLDFNLETLSYNFSLFLCFKDLKSFIQKRMITKSFKRWQHQFTSSVLRQIKKAQSLKNRTSNDYNLDKNLTISYNYNYPPIQTTNQLFISNDAYNTQYPDQNISKPLHHSHKHSIIMEDPTNFDSIPDAPFQGTSNPDEIAHSVISPNSSILIASTSPRNMDNGLSSSLSVDEALDFTNYENSNKPSPKKADLVDNFLQTITEFVSSDEFNSDSLGQISTQIKDPKANQKNNSPQSPSPPSNKINPKLYYHDNNQDDPLGSTLPTDLFTSSNSDNSLNELPSQSYCKDEYTQSPKKKKQSPIKMDEELLIKAALVDEFEHDKRKAKAKKNDSDIPLQSSPRSKKRRKIIIVREYSDNDDLDLHKNDDNFNFNLINNDNNDADIIYQNQKRKNSLPVRKKQKYESPQKKFIFSDESFSDDGNHFNDNNNLNYNYSNNDDIKNENYSYDPDSAKNNNNSYQDKNINHNSYNISNNNTQSASNKKRPKKHENIGLNEEESLLHLSSTIEIPKVELKDIVKSSSKNNADTQMDDSSFSSDKNVSVMTMTEDRKNKNSDSEPFYGFGRKNNEIPGVDSSDEIEYLIKDDNENVNYVPKKSYDKLNKPQNDFNNNNFSYNDISSDDF